MILTQSSRLVSVGMCAYNVEGYIAESVASVLNQSYEDLELIIVDDGSTDGTLSIAQSLSRDDNRIRLIRHEQNRGLTAARNRTLFEARGEYFAIADADDFHMPERLEQQRAVLNADSKTGIVGSKVSFYETGSAPKPSQLVLASDREIRFAMLFHPALWNTTTMYRTEQVRAIGGYRSIFDRGAEDYDLWCRMSTTTRFANVMQHLVKVRLHPTSVTHGNDQCLSNILEVSRGELFRHLGICISLPARRALHGFLNHQSLDIESHGLALEVTECLVHTFDQQRDSKPTADFLSRLATAAWVQAEYEVYRNPSVSDAYLAVADRLNVAAALSSRAALMTRRLYRPFRKLRVRLS